MLKLVSWPIGQAPEKVASFKEVDTSTKNINKWYKYFDVQIQSAWSSSLRMLRKKIGATTLFIWSEPSWGHTNTSCCNDKNCIFHHCFLISRSIHTFTKHIKVDSICFPLPSQLHDTIDYRLDKRQNVFPLRFSICYMVLDVGAIIKLHSMTCEKATFCPTCEENMPHIKYAKANHMGKNAKRNDKIRYASIPQFYSIVMYSLLIMDQHPQTGSGSGIGNGA